MTFELPLVRIEDRVLLPGLVTVVPIDARARRTLELAADTAKKRVAAVLTFQDGIAPIGSVCAIEAMTEEHARLRAESRVRILFARGDVAAVEAYENRERTVSPEEEDRVRALLLTKITQGLRVPGDVVEQVALTRDPERLAYLVLAYSGAPVGRLQRALELLDAAARLALVR